MQSIQKYKGVWTTAYTFQLVHAAALMAAPVLPSVAITGTAIAAGTVLFSGSCYAVAFMADRSVGKLAPVGGMLMIAGWLAIAIM